MSLLYRRFLPGVFGYIASRVPDRATAEDLTSDVFLAMVEGIAQQRYDEEARFTAWLFRIARTTVASYYRKHAKRPSIVPFTAIAHAKTPLDGDGLSTDQVADPVEWAEARDEWGHVVQAINQLTEEQRLVVVGRFLLDYDVATVAKIVGKKANAVKALQFRALRSLQRFLVPSAPSPASEEHGERLKGGCNDVIK
ncbi:RNA polymerase sigma factor [Ktedonospora formicarum]|nr:sigma-70 family RNA polymerase sigma factor [Ktedonospora formicarum]